MTDSGGVTFMVTWKKSPSSSYQGLIGLLVLVLVILAFIVLSYTLETNDVTLTEPPTSVLIFEFLTLTYSWQAPPLFAVIAAIAIGFIVVVSFVGLELRDANLSRRSHDSVHKKLSPWVLMESTKGVFHGEVTLTALIPAHNEEKLIGATIRSLMEQDRKPERIIVVADNCNDGTVEVARSLGVEVYETVNNHEKKAGALNQVLTVLLPQMGENDTVMIMDADTVLRQGFLKAAIKHFVDDRGLSAIGGLFFGEDKPGLIAQIQRNEYTRYSREINRRKGRVFVLTGTASIFRARALRTVAEERGTLLPGTNGHVYDTHALTEDNELTLALKTLGALMTSPPECMVETELMPSLSALWRQRLRWERGAMENIATYGITSTTARYWSQQLGLAYSVFALWTYFLLIVLQVLSSDTWIWYPFWILMGAIFVAEKVFTVRKASWKAKFLASTLVIELLYDTFLGIIFVKGTVDMAFGRKAHWGDAHAPAKHNAHKHPIPRHKLEHHSPSKHRGKK
jgi:cellulose synthase/poly-beta-1,6-N-acetylglucosamine synthase-like glycosyltransferase